MGAAIVTTASSATLTDALEVVLVATTTPPTLAVMAYPVPGAVRVRVCVGTAALVVPLAEAASDSE